MRSLINLSWFVWKVKTTFFDALLFGLLSLYRIHLYMDLCKQHIDTSAVHCDDAFGRSNIFLMSTTWCMLVWIVDVKYFPLHNFTACCAHLTRFTLNINALTSDVVLKTTLDARFYCTRWCRFVRLLFGSENIWNFLK